MKSPIFIFSLPRSGSTLLQRLLMSHKSISSVSEPWLLLPFVYANKGTGTLSEYSSQNSFIGLSDFINNLPNKEADYVEALRNFIIELYSKHCNNGEIYFLDKTPRYYLIIDEILELFPNAKFIFLFRNPVQVYASLITTFADNKLTYYQTNEDLLDGMRLLSEGYEKYKNKSIHINYEDLVTSPKAQIEKVFNYLNLEIDYSVLNNFSNQNTKGRFGDPSGIKEYNNVSSNSVSKWKMIFNTPIRKKYLLILINKIEAKHIQIQGYDKEQIIKEIKNIRAVYNSIFSDLFYLIRYYMIRKFKLNIFFAKSLKWANNIFFS